MKYGNWFIFEIFFGYEIIMIDMEKIRKFFYSYIVDKSSICWWEFEVWSVLNSVGYIGIVDLE